ncbi:hypothetical protein FPRO06_03694 [Fusarium proliferatum]|nr:hypothetical protein FPRO03_08162 [Fusarium proliferatum]KAG4272439.1 hypothetical protein FPRO04_02496 [Fusarium proliferatum]KAG4288872.1 hypothetical protein FPRO06_03694 [Fusarium proliferatum]
MLRPLARKFPTNLRTIQRNSFSSTSAARADFTHAVIGGGVVGLAVARQLAQRDDTSTVLIERHNAIGTETSSRNSEVIHAGIYYGPSSLKAKLCIRGKNLLYELCEKHDIGHRRTGKWIVAQNDAQRDTLEKIHSLITAETLINAAGLGAAVIHNMIVPSEKRQELYYAKGNYFSYSASQPKISRLIYPVPEPGIAGLGTHLTLDLAGRLRFGPDVEWIDDPNDLAVNAARLPQAITEIQRYLPGIDASALVADYAGIRPKLAGQEAVLKGKGFHDFIIRKEEGYEGWVNLLGIESPGLTSSLAIAEMVQELLYGTSKSL